MTGDGRPPCSRTTSSLPGFPGKPSDKAPSRDRSPDLSRLARGALLELNRLRGDWVEHGLTAGIVRTAGTRPQNRPTGNAAVERYGPCTSPDQPEIAGRHSPPETVTWL